MLMFGKLDDRDRKGKKHNTIKYILISLTLIFQKWSLYCLKRQLSVSFVMQKWLSSWTESAQQIPATISQSVNSRKATDLVEVSYSQTLSLLTSENAIQMKFNRSYRISIFSIHRRLFHNLFHLQEFTEFLFDKFSIVL